MIHHRHFSRLIAGSPLAILAFTPLAACSSGGGTSGSPITSAATCSSPGQPTPGPADTHCALDDGGMIVQPTNQASCTVADAGAASGDDGGAADDAATSADSGGPSGGGADSCPYGPTMYGQESDDDDCKYHVKWTSTPICEQGGGPAPAPVIFTVTVTNKVDGTPLTGAATRIEAFATTAGDWDAATYCDTKSTHIDQNNLFDPLHEGPPGTYKGPVYFDQPGQWTVRFHFFENCFDVLETSPHGHAAYHVT